MDRSIFSTANPQVSFANQDRTAVKVILRKIPIGVQHIQVAVGLLRTPRNRGLIVYLLNPKLPHHLPLVLPLNTTNQISNIIWKTPLKRIRHSLHFLNNNQCNQTYLSNSSNQSSNSCRINSSHLYSVNHLILTSSNSRNSCISKQAKIITQVRILPSVILILLQLQGVLH